MKKDKLYISAVIVAAGRGTRMNMEMNKQYIEVCGKPVLAWTLQVFEDTVVIDEIILVVNEQELVYCKQQIVEKYKLKKVRTLVAGGKERQDSVYSGLMEVDPSCDIVLVHDGARPFVTRKILEESIDAAREFGASCVAVPVKDTIKIEDSNQFVNETLDRSILWAIQTPQTFQFDLLFKAHNKAMEEGFKGTDDSVLVERMGVRTKLTMGSYNNIKITTKEDLVMAEAIARSME